MAKTKYAKERLRAPLATRCRPLSLVARRKIVAIHRLQVGRKVGPFGQLLRRFQSLARMGKPGNAFVIGGPIARRPLDALQDTKQPGIFGEPALQQAPLAQAAPHAPARW